MSSRKNPQDYSVLNLNRFNELCFVLGVKELSCYDPDKKAIERAFRKRALKTHPDKGGDPIEFKKINDAYNKLIGHIFKLEQQAEQNELAESILIEVSKTSLPKWVEKLKKSYGYFKSSECKCIIFEGPYKQFKGRGKMTGPITIVLYEDPQDAIPKIHIRSPKFMAWIAEQMMPVHMHVDKGKTIQFNQWRIAHPAEFGIEAFKTPMTPAPERKAPAPTPAPENKPKRKARDSSVPKPKTRRDSEPSPSPGAGFGAGDNTPDKENQEPDDNDDDNVGENEKEEIDPKPRTGKKIRKRRPPKPKPPPPEYVYNCGHCGSGFNSMLEFNYHKTKCIPDEDFNQYAEHIKAKRKQTDDKMEVDDSKDKVEEKGNHSENKSTAASDKQLRRPSDIDPSIFNFLTGMTSPPVKKSADEPSFTCIGCSAGFQNLKDYGNHKKNCSGASPPSSVASPEILPRDKHSEESTETVSKDNAKPAQQTTEKVSMENAPSNPNASDHTVEPESEISSKAALIKKTLKTTFHLKRHNVEVKTETDIGNSDDLTEDITSNVNTTTSNDDDGIKQAECETKTVFKTNGINLEKTKDINNEESSQEMKKEPVEKDIHPEVTKKKEKIKLTSSSKVTKNTKPHSTTTKKVVLEKEIIMDSKNNDDIIKVADSKLKTKQEKEVLNNSTNYKDKTNQNTNIQMSSLKDNLPADAANIEMPSVDTSSVLINDGNNENLTDNFTATSSKNSEEAPPPLLKEEVYPVDPEIKHKMEPDTNLKSKPGDEEHTVLKNKNIQELQNALKPRVSFSDDLPLSSNKHKNGRSSKDSPKLLRKDDIKKASSKLHKSDESPKSSPKLLKKLVNLTTCLSHSHIKVDHIEEIAPKSSPPLRMVKETTLVSDSPKVQKSILKDKGNKTTSNVISQTPDDLNNEIYKLSQPNINSPKINNLSENNISNNNASPMLKESKLSIISSKSDIQESKSIQDFKNDKLNVKSKEIKKYENVVNNLSVEKKGQSGTLNEKPSVTFSSNIEDDKSINNPATRIDKVKESKSKTTPFKTSNTQEPTVVLEDKVKNLDLKNSLFKVSSQLTERVSTNKVSSKDDIVIPPIVSSHVKKTEPIAVSKTEVTVKEPVKVSKAEVTVKEPVTVSKGEATVREPIKVSDSEAIVKEPIVEYKAKPTLKEPNLVYQSEVTKKEDNKEFKDWAKVKESVLESPLKVKENHQTTFHKAPASNKESVIKSIDQNKDQNNSKTYHKLDVEALRLADNILLTHSHDDELNTEKFVEADCKKLQLHMRPFTKHHLEEQHSLDHQAIKVSNNIFSDNTKLSEKELQANNDKIPSKQKNKDSHESFKQSPIIHQAQQCFVVNKAVIPDRTPSNNIDLKTISPKQEEKPNNAKETSRAHMASSVIFTKANTDTEPKIDTTKKSNVASSVIFTKSSRDPEPMKTPINISSRDSEPMKTPINISSRDSEPMKTAINKSSRESEPMKTPINISSRDLEPMKTAINKSSRESEPMKTPINKSSRDSEAMKTSINKSSLESSKNAGKPPLSIETPALERRRRLHEQDHRQKVPSSLGFSRFELTDFDVSHPVTRNATQSDIPSSRSRTLTSISQSSSFAFESKPITTPQTQRKFQDRNFNVAPAPYSSKNNVHFSDNKDIGINKEKAYQSSNSCQKPATSRSVTTSPNRYASYGDTTGISTSSYTTASSSRAKSEGYNRFGGTLGEPSKSTTNSELMKKIQASKDMYKASYDKAMNFDRTASAKPVVYIPKLPRPGKEYDKYLETAERDKYLRRMERDKSVMDKVLTTRGARSPSTHK